MSRRKHKANSGVARSRLGFETLEHRLQFSVDYAPFAATFPLNALTASDSINFEIADGVYMGLPLGGGLSADYDPIPLELKVAQVIQPIEFLDTSNLEIRSIPSPLSNTSPLIWGDTSRLNMFPGVFGKTVAFHDESFGNTALSDLVGDLEGAILSESIQPSLRLPTTGQFAGLASDVTSILFESNDAHALDVSPILFGVADTEVWGLSIRPIPSLFSFQAVAGTPVLTTNEGLAFQGLSEPLGTAWGSTTIVSMEMEAGLANEKAPDATGTFVRSADGATEAHDTRHQSLIVTKTIDGQPWYSLIQHTNATHTLQLFETFERDLQVLALHSAQGNHFFQQIVEPKYLDSQLATNSTFSTEDHFNTPLSREHIETNKAKDFHFSETARITEFSVGNTNALLAIENLPSEMLPIGGEVGLYMHKGRRSHIQTESFIVQASLICDEPQRVVLSYVEPTSDTALAGVTESNNDRYSWIAVGGIILVVAIRLWPRDFEQTSFSLGLWLHSLKLRKHLPRNSL